MAKTPALSAAQLQDLTNILEDRYTLLQRPELLRLRELVRIAAEGVDDALKEYSAPEENASSEQDLAERHAHEMHSIEQASKRLLEGSYGNCTDCLSAIDFQRLLVCPTALRCMKCQEVHELLQKRGR
jgi:DnaK suppressor protein